MFEKLLRAAERAADGVSRREFLGRLGRGAAAAGVLAGATAAAAGGGGGGACPVYPGSTLACSGSYEGAPCYIDARTSGRCTRGSSGGCYCEAKRRRPR